MEKTKEKNISIGEAFNYVFKEEGWVSKVLVGGLVVIASVLILPLPFLGWYQVTVFKNIVEEKKPYLPKWEFNTANYVTGLKFFAVAIILYLPSLIFSVFGETLGSLLQTLYSLAMMAVLPFVIGGFAKNLKIAEAFDFKSIFKKVQSNVGLLVVYIIGVFLAGLAAMLGLIALIIGVVFTAFWSNLVETYLMAKVYSVTKE